MASFGHCHCHWLCSSGSLSSALVGRAPEASPWFVRRRGVIIDVPEGAVAGSRAIVSLPDDGDARQATVTIAFPPGLSTGQELTVALEV